MKYQYENNIEWFLKKCKSFNEDISFNDYIQMVCKCLVISDYNYSVSEALKRTINNLDSIKIFYENKESAYDCMIELGYCCG